MKFKAVIFDMDGTILDTEKLWKETDKRIIQKRGLPIPDSFDHITKEKLVGSSLHESCCVLKEIAGLDDPVEALAQEKAALVYELYQQGVVFIDGFLRFHQKVRAHKLLVGLATNTDDKIVTLTKQLLKLETLFGNHIYTASAVSRPKPAPEIYLHTAHQLGVTPKECIVVEDSAIGVQAATDADMFCIGINTSKNPELLRKAKFIIDHYDEIRLEKLLGIKDKD